MSWTFTVGVCWGRWDKRIAPALWSAMLSHLWVALTLSWTLRRQKIQRTALLAMSLVALL